MILLSDEEWDISELKNAFGSGTISRDNVISKVHEIYDQVHFVCVRNASDHFPGFFLQSSCLHCDLHILRQNVLRK